MTSEKGNKEAERFKFESKPNRTIQEYIKERVEFKIGIYYKKAKRNRFYHYLFSVVIGINAALVPILINMEDGSKLFLYIATVLSVLVTISVALQEIFRFREHWRNYNLIESTLRSEEMLFSMSAGEYTESKNPEERLKCFVRRVENLIQEERKETINMRTTLSSSKEGPSDILMTDT